MSEALVDSFWDILRWREILTFSLCIAIPVLFHKDNKLKLLALALILVCIPSVIFSGGRVVYFAVTIAVVAYFFLLKRDKIKHFILFAVICSGLIYFVPNPVFKAIDHRVESIFNTESNYSNIGRLHMYKEGSIFIYHQLVNHPKSILFGMGEKGFNQEFVHYLTQEGKYEHLMEITNRQFSVRDQHNALLNTLSKQGMLYFVMFYSMMLFLFFKTYQSAVQGHIFSQSALVLLVGYMSIGMLYGNEFSFDTIIMFTLWCLLFSMRNNTGTEQKNTESVNEKDGDIVKGDL
ncbi:O-antigen ligase family protein [Vibrio aerogenes]